MHHTVVGLEATMTSRARHFGCMTPCSSLGGEVHTTLLPRPVSARRPASALSGRRWPPRPEAHKDRLLDPISPFHSEGRCTTIGPLPPPRPLACSPVAVGGPCQQGAARLRPSGPSDTARPAGPPRHLTSPLTKQRKSTGNPLDIRSFVSEPLTSEMSNNFTGRRRIPFCLFRIIGYHKGCLKQTLKRWKTAPNHNPTTIHHFLLVLQGVRRVWEQRGGGGRVGRGFDPRQPLFLRRTTLRILAGAWTWPWRRGHVSGLGLGLTAVGRPGRAGHWLPSTDLRQTKHRTLRE